MQGWFRLKLVRNSVTPLISSPPQPLALSSPHLLLPAGSCPTARGCHSRSHIFSQSSLAVLPSCYARHQVQFSLHCCIWWKQTLHLGQHFEFMVCNALPPKTAKNAPIVEQCQTVVARREHTHPGKCGGVSGGGFFFF